MAQKKKAKKSRAPKTSPVVEALTAVSGELNGINERLDTVQEDVGTLREEVAEVKTAASAKAPEVANESPAPANTDALDALVKSQQKEAVKRLRDEVLPEARRAQRFYGYLTVSEDGGEFEMEKVESVSRLEEILKGVEAGTTRVLMNPFASKPEATAETTKTKTLAIDGVSMSETTTTKKTGPKRGLLSRFLGL